MPKKISSVIIIICLTVFIFSQCLNSNPKNDDPRGDTYAGSAACSNCHKDIFTSYLHTAHYHSVSAATVASVHGSFVKDSNVFVINGNSRIVMEKRNNGMYQVYYSGGKEMDAQRFDIVFGSVKGETYLYWKNNLLFQLPVSFSNAVHSWTNSPGYNPGEVNFMRPIARRCFECHSSYIKETGQPLTGRQAGEPLDKASLIYSIDCERCHGPGAEHVNFQTNNPGIKTAKYIISYHSLSRSQKVDMCAQCHSGNTSIMLRSIFAFRPGDTLANYKLPDFYTSGGNVSADVHGHQSQLLAESKCFINSKMDCATCHSPHENERGDLTLYNQRCRNCHTVTNHDSVTKENRQLNDFINTNCIKCHMPVQPSKGIVMQTSGNGSPIPATAVNHRIAVYPEETKKITSLFQR